MSGAALQVELERMYLNFEKKNYLVFLARVTHKVPVKFQKCVKNKVLLFVVKGINYSFSRSKYFHLLLEPIKGFISLIG